MTFAPVLPPLILASVAVAALLLRLVTMRRLATTSARWPTVWRWSGLTLAVLLLMIAAANPGIGHDGPHPAPRAHSDTGANVFLVVDRSIDAPGIRADVEALIDRHRGARFAMISFASRPSLDWPLSEDVWSLEPVIATLAPYRTAAESGEQVNAAAAATMLRYQLIAAGQQYPGAQTLVYYLGAGAPGSRAPQGDFDPVPGSVDGGAVLGHGAARDEATLRRIARELGVPYINRTGSEPLAEAVPDPGTPDATEPGAPPVTERADLYWMFALVAAVLLVFEIYLSLRDFRRTRMPRREMTL
ncbi:vWA domain-containing protein [Mycolicibacterium sp. XJ1819]